MSSIHSQMDQVERVLCIALLTSSIKLRLFQNKSMVMEKDGEGNGNLLQYSCLGNPMDKRNLAGYSPWGHKRVGHDLETKQQQYIHSYCNHILPLD